jgi:hypothetical protein
MRQHGHNGNNRKWRAQPVRRGFEPRPAFFIFERDLRLLHTQLTPRYAGGELQRKGWRRARWSHARPWAVRRQQQADKGQADRDGCVDAVVARLWHAARVCRFDVVNDVLLRLRADVYLSRHCTYIPFREQGCV